MGCFRYPWRTASAVQTGIGDPFVLEEQADLALVRATWVKSEVLSRLPPFSILILSISIMCALSSVSSGFPLIRRRVFIR